MNRVVDDPFLILIPIGLLVATVLIGFLVRRALFTALCRWARSADSQLDIVVTSTLKGPILLWSAILGLHIATQNSEIPQQYLQYIPRTLQALWGLSLMIALIQLAGSVVRHYGGSLAGMRSVTSLSGRLIQIVIFAIGTLWLVKVVFDVSLTPYFATLGVGGVAVALALKDTLSNLFAGFLVSISDLVHIGDFIRLTTNEEGFVTDVTWRCTTVRTRTNNLLVIPNSKLVEAIYTNYSMPESRLTASLLCGVAGNADVEKTQAILLDEVVRALPGIKGALADPPPQVFFNPGPWNGAFVFQVAYPVSSVADFPFTRSEVRKRLVTRLTAEGIGVNFPAASTPTPNEFAGL